MSLPIDCELGAACYVQQYMDQDSSEDSQDFLCGPRSYNAHKGTDFAVATVAIAKQGIDVLAAAQGTVLGVRDGMQDTWNGVIDSAAIKGRDCGNGLVIDHGDGWQTQYCHMQRGTLAVAKGDVIETGHYLGKIGMSGRAEFPHLHLSVRQNGDPVDPFAPDGATCNEQPTETMWTEVPLYQAGGVLDIGFSDKVPKYANVKLGTANQRLNRTSPALVTYSYFFGGETGDIVEMSFTGPGNINVSDRHEVTKNRALFFRAIGKKRRSAPWPGGTYRAETHLIRDGEIIASKRASFEIAR